MWDTLLLGQSKGGPCPIAPLFTQGVPGTRLCVREQWGPYWTALHKCHENHMTHIMLHLAAAHRIGPKTPPETRNLAPQSCRVPGCSYRTVAGIFKSVSKKKEEMWLQLTMDHGVVRPLETGFPQAAWNKRVSEPEGLFMNQLLQGLRSKVFCKKVLQG